MKNNEVYTQSKGCSSKEFATASGGEGFRRFHKEKPCKHPSRRPRFPVFPGIGCLIGATLFSALLAGCRPPSSAPLSDSPAPSSSPHRKWTSEELRWVDRIIPLPQHMNVNGTVTATVNEIALELPALDAPEEETIRALLEPWAKGRIEDARVVLHIRRVDWDDADLPEAAHPLRSAPNRDQGYAIVHEAAAEGPEALYLLAGSARGALNGARTLAMLVRLLDPAIPAGPVEVPRVTIADWPDMADRGLFGSRGEENLEWLAQWKWNYFSESSHLLFDANAPPPSDPSGDWPPLVSRRGDRWDALPGQAAQQGMDVIPRLTHVGDNQFLLGRAIGLGLPGHDFPGARDILAVPDPSPENKAARGLCWSNPRTVHLIADGLLASAALAKTDPPVVEVWMTEAGHLACFCDGCQGRDGFLLEARGLVEALEQARKQRPDLRMILMNSLGSAHVDEEILRGLPENTEFRCYVYRSYSTDHRPMLPAFLKRAARGGRDASALIQITPSFFAVFPGSFPQFIQYRAQEFHAEGLSGIMTYSVPDRHFFPVNNAAAGEWAWNANGRSVRDFARAYATVTGMADPELYAKWIESAGEAAWWLADSRFIDTLCRNPRLIMDPIAETYPDGDQRLKIYRIPDLDTVLEQARRAMELANRSGDARLRAESGSVLAALYAYELAEHIREAKAQGATRPDLLQKIDRLEIYARQIQGYSDAWYRLSGWPFLPARHPRANLPQQALLLACDAWRATLGEPDRYRAGAWSPSEADAELDGEAVVEVFFDAPAGFPAEAGAVNVEVDLTRGRQVVRYRNTRLEVENTGTGEFRTVAQSDVRSSYTHVGSASYIPEPLRSHFLRPNSREGRRSNEVLPLPPPGENERLRVRLECTKFSIDAPFSPETVVTVYMRPAWIFDENTPSPLDNVESWR